MTYLEPHKKALVESFQRRNLLVHNNGTVNAIYLSKVDKSLTSGVELGALLDVTAEYFAETTNRLELCFDLIAAELWRKIEPTNEERSSALTTLVLSHLKAERYAIAEGLSRFVGEDKKLSERSQLIGRINYWQSRKWSGRYDEVRREVDELDLSAKTIEFRLAVLALQDKSDEFMALLPKALEGGQLSREDIATWPLFREMRRVPSCQQYLPTTQLDSSQLSSTDALGTLSDPPAANVGARADELLATVVSDEPRPSDV